MPARLAHWGLLLLVCSVATAFAAEKEFNAAQTARDILGDSVGDARRDELIAESVPHAAAVIRAMTKDLPDDQAEEYRRIPWIWRVAIAAGQKNDEKSLRPLLEASLPAEQHELKDWQSVVIGGGVINGISQSGAWPSERMKELIGGDESLQKRWKHTIEEAVQMVDDEATPPGTRYDALRILGAAEWKTHAEQIRKYLAKDAHSELQMGAVSAAGDAKDRDAAESLIEHLADLTESNRSMAITALLRNSERRQLLRAALESGKAQSDWLDDEQKEALNQ